MDESVMLQLPGWMGALPDLAYLDLNDVKLDMTGWSFPGIKSLQSLDISSCNLGMVRSSRVYLAIASRADCIYSSSARELTMEF